MFCYTGYNQQNLYYSSVPYDAYVPQGDANAAPPAESNTFDYYGMSSLRQVSTANKQHKVKLNANPKLQ